MKLGRMLILALPFVLVSASPAAAKGAPAGASLSGCKGSASSSLPDGGRLSSVTVPGSPPASKGNPFVVDYDGVVDYEGQSDTVITDNSWRISVYGIPVKSGGSANEDEKKKSSGVVQVSDYLPIKAVGLFYVSGEITGTGTPCSGSVWLKVDGSPTGTIPWIAGLVLTGLGLVGVISSRPKALAVAAPPEPTTRAGLAGDE